VIDAAASSDGGADPVGVDLEFSSARRCGPPHPADQAADREGLALDVAAVFAGRRAGVRFGSWSYGGRMAHALAAERPALSPDSCFSGYPLHPPRKPKRRAPRIGRNFVFRSSSSRARATRSELREFRAAFEILPMRPARTTSSRARVTTCASAWFNCSTNRRLILDAWFESMREA
jgi:hypothetical protein